MKYLSLLLFFFIVSCQTYEPCYPELGYRNWTSYPAPDGGMDPVAAKVLKDVETCLAPLKDNWISRDEQIRAECWGRQTLQLRSCLQVSVPPDWYVSQCSGEQVFPCDIGPERCLQKGLVPDGGCPCRCRAQIQDGTVIWTTPNYRLLAATAVTVMTDCLSPWTEHLSPCSSIRPDFSILDGGI